MDVPRTAIGQARVDRDAEVWSCRAVSVTQANAAYHAATIPEKQQHREALAAAILACCHEVARRYDLPRQIIDELAQDRAAKLMGFLERSGPTGTEDGLVVTSMRNRIRDWYRKQARSPERLGTTPDLPEPPSPPPEAGDEEWLTPLVRTNLSRVKNEAYQQILDHVHLRQMPLDELVDRQLAEEVATSAVASADVERRRAQIRNLYDKKVQRARTALLVVLVKEFQLIDRAPDRVRGALRAEFLDRRSRKEIVVAQIAELSALPEGLDDGDLEQALTLEHTRRVKEGLHWMLRALLQIGEGP